MRWVHDVSKREATPDAKRLAQLESDNAALRSELANALDSYARLKKAYTQALEQLHLLRLRLFVAKAERVEPSADQLAFDALLEHVKTLEAALDAQAPESDSGGDDGDGNDKPKGRPSKPKGRRSLTDGDSTLPKVRVEVPDPQFEGKVERIGFEVTYQLGYQRGGMRRIEIARAVYRMPPPPKKTEESVATDTLTDEAQKAKDETLWRIVTADLPSQLFARGLLAPSMVAHVLVQKYMMGVPFYRLEKRFSLEGASLDRGTMCRYAEDAGATLGAIVLAMREHAFNTAFCLSTDATGVSIQPEPVADGRRQACRKAHFFVVLADRDHVFFEYQAKHTSAVVCEMFRGFSRYIQADASAVYDALFRGAAPASQDDEAATGPPPTEVGCWSHVRRNFWEAAVCKHALGLDGLRRIDALFAVEKRLSDLPPSTRKSRREVLLRPLIDAFFKWVTDEYAKVQSRGLVKTALGYALNQQGALRRFLDHGRLEMTNNGSERALRSIAVGRKNWLFIGSDDHANAAANLFSLIASCKLHSLDPEAYFADLIHLMPFWPRDRYIELAPKFWAATRARLNTKEMSVEIGRVTVPPPLPAEEQSASR